LQYNVRWYDGGNRVDSLVSTKSTIDLINAVVGDAYSHDLGSVGNWSASSTFYHSSASYDIHYSVIFTTKTGSPVVQFKGVLEYLGP
jgi:predicted anti-sigma-YlaC factor YlaD